MLIIAIFYLYLFILPFIGLYQLSNSIYRYSQLESPATLKADITKYWQVVAVYFSILIIGILQPIQLTSSNAGSVLSVFYCCCVPALIAIYYSNLKHKEHYEELEKLVF